ncbi:MAG: hypothetical protein GY725_19520 [bacterium]|nr:hypothetical protein [bacterium]
MSLKRNLLLLTLLLFLSAGSLGLLRPAMAGLPAVSASPTPIPERAAAGRSFSKFCNTWMTKLARRELDNRRSARPRRSGSKWVLEYIGYAKHHDRCEAKATGVSQNPYIGKMVYTEAKYRASGKTKESVRNGSASVISLAETEVMEIFRFDGKKWVY